MYLRKKKETNSEKEHKKHLEKIDTAIAEAKQLLKEIELSFSQVPLDCYPNSKGFDLMRRGVEIICTQEIELLEKKKAYLLESLVKMHNKERDDLT